jgi:hypothetical protein
MCIDTAPEQLPMPPDEQHMARSVTSTHMSPFRPTELHPPPIPPPPLPTPAQDLRGFLEAAISRHSSPEESLQRLDELNGRHVDQLRRLTKAIQDARLARDQEAVRRAVDEYDEALEAYVPGGCAGWVGRVRAPRPGAQSYGAAQCQCGQGRPGEGGLPCCWPVEAELLVTGGRRCSSAGASDLTAGAGLGARPCRPDGHRRRILGRRAVLCR